MPVGDECRVQALLFASLRDRAGWSSRTLTLPSRTGCTARELWQQLNLGPLPDGVRIAINHTFVSIDQLLQEGDELAFLPPFTGG